MTGATSGIGKVAAERVAGLGARLVLVVRDRAFGNAMLVKLNAAAPGISHSVADRAFAARRVNGRSGIPREACALLRLEASRIDRGSRIGGQSAEPA
jgi:NAD(P)-dependent dehydrogenase (short-subunit alcohol dehydrogenase family)